MVPIRPKAGLLIGGRQIAGMGPVLALAWRLSLPLSAPMVTENAQLP